MREEGEGVGDCGLQRGRVSGLAYCLVAIWLMCEKMSVVFIVSVWVCNYLFVVVINDKHRSQRRVRVRRHRSERVIPFKFVNLAGQARHE